MRLSLCVPTANPKLFASAVRHALGNATGPVDIVGFGNGCKLDRWVLNEVDPGGPLAAPDPLPFWYFFDRSDGNIGVPAALHRIWTLARGLQSDSCEHILAYIHDDLEIHEKGWDKRVIAAFERDPKIGLVGFGGATALGGDEIYKAPYEIHQLGRRDFYSNMNGAEVHGHRTTEERPIVFTDGMSMIVRRSLLDAIGGWSWWPFELVHHAYDYGIACMARRHGYKAWLVPCAIHHIGGQTAMMPVHQDMAKRYGGDNVVHAAAHRFVYETFRDVYPLRLP